MSKSVDENVAEGQRQISLMDKRPANVYHMEEEAESVLARECEALLHLVVLV